jgi:uncharacterized protein (DUF3820 family)
MIFDRTFLIRLVKARMPYGRFQNRYITELPVSYLEWIHRNGYPSGNLGQYLSTMHEIKINGLDYLLDPIISAQRKNK